MANPSSPAAHQSSPPFFESVVAWFVVTLVGPVLQWLMGMIFGVYGPVPPVSTWMRFVAVMAVFGTIAGVVTFLAERSGNRWARSFAFTLVIASITVARIDDFAREPLRDFILTSVLGILFTALLMGSIFYATGFPKP